MSHTPELSYAELKNQSMPIGSKISWTCDPNCGGESQTVVVTENGILRVKSVYHALTNGLRANLVTDRTKKFFDNIAEWNKSLQWGGMFTVFAKKSAIEKKLDFMPAGSDAFKIEELITRFKITQIYQPNWSPAEALENRQRIVNHYYESLSNIILEEDIANPAKRRSLTRAFSVVIKLFNAEKNLMESLTEEEKHYAAPGHIWAPRPRLWIILNGNHVLITARNGKVQVDGYMPVDSLSEIAPAPHRMIVQYRGRASHFEL